MRIIARKAPQYTKTSWIESPNETSPFHFAVFFLLLVDDRHQRVCRRKIVAAKHASIGCPYETLEDIKKKRAASIIRQRVQYNLDDDFVDLRRTLDREMNRKVRNGI